jgi:AraC family transcriptional regulator
MLAKPDSQAAQSRTVQGRTDPKIQASVAVRSAIQCIGRAGEALTANADEAEKFIALALTLLKAEASSAESAEADETETGECRLAAWQVNRVKCFVEANLGGKIGPAQFAVLARLSVSHFRRAFRATVGKSPRVYLTHRRIDRAKELMLETDLSLAKIARECGFCDQAHLTRLFVTAVGTSPAAWRRVHVPHLVNRTRQES